MTRPGHLVAVATLVAWAGGGGRAWAQAPGDPPEAPAAAEAEGEDAADRARAPVGAGDRDLARRFDGALARFHAGDFVPAAIGLHAFLRAATPLTDNLGAAQLLLGQCLERLQLPYAAGTFYYLVAKTRVQPEVIADALTRLRALGEGDSFDEDLIVDDLIYDGDFGVLSGDLGGWVNFTKGRQDWRLGFPEWGERHFKEIDPRGPWQAEADFVRAVAATREHQDVEAEALFNAVRDHPRAPPRLRREADLSLARLAFEREQWPQALAAYDRVEVQRLTYEEAQVLAEKAWVHFYSGDPAKTLGLLHALASPAYAPYFFPDTYLLKALVYKDLCHVLSAKRTVRAFRLHYQRVFDQLQARVPLEQVEPVRRAALTAGAIAPRTRLLRALARQRQRLNELGGLSDTPLYRDLLEVVSGAQKTNQRRWQREFDAAADRVAGQLLDTREQMALLDYEVSLDIYRPLGDRKMTPVENAETPWPEAGFFDAYLFDGEYWNPELDHYRVFIKSRCFQEDGP